MKRTIGPWLVFLVLGGALGFARYGGMLSSHYLSYSVKYGAFVVLGMHIILVLHAFKESVFQGILSLLVPLYSFYFLFVISDAFYLRAVFAGILVGIGQDSAFVWQDWIMTIIRTVTSWIQSGGGDVQRF